MCWDGIPLLSRGTILNDHNVYGTWSKTPPVLCQRLKKKKNKTISDESKTQGNTQRQLILKNAVRVELSLWCGTYSHTFQFCLTLAALIFWFWAHCWGNCYGGRCIGALAGNESEGVLLVEIILPPLCLANARAPSDPPFCLAEIGPSWLFCHKQRFCLVEMNSLWKILIFAASKI